MLLLAVEWSRMGVINLPIVAMQVNMANKCPPVSLLVSRSISYLKQELQSTTHFRDSS